MLNFGTSLSALQASQLALDTIANNIANANTPGYHRQAIYLNDRSPILRDNFWVGTGVQVGNINQIASAAVENALTQNVSRRADTNQSLELLNAVESLFAPGDGSIHQRFEMFFAELHSLQARPADPTQRQILLNKTQSLASEINSMWNHLESLKTTSRELVDQSIELVNQQLDSLANLNRLIRQARASGTQPNDLLDQHQQLVNQIAETIDIEVNPAGTGFSYQFAGNHLAVAHSTLQLNYRLTGTDTIEIFSDSNQGPLHFQSGKLAALQQFHNVDAVTYQSRLNELASGFIQALDHVHSTGIGLNGPLEQVTGHRSVTDANLPLAQAAVPFSLENGTLFVSITDGASDQRTLHAIDIDPTVDSLNDFADAISQLDHVRAVVNWQNSTISILAEPGFAFDFAGRLPSQPDRTSITGDAAIRFSGQYTGGENDDFQFEIVGNGTVGVSTDLAVRVTNQAGENIGTFNIGKGYEPGSTIAVAQGVSIEFDSGTLNQGDRFSVPAVADADTGQVLVALGLNTFFHGSSASSIAVNADLLEHPDRLATSRSGSPGDGDNVGRMLGLRTQGRVGDLSFEQSLVDTTSAAAIAVNELTSQQNNLAVVHSRLVDERAAISGVDLNEEMVHMLQFQRSFQAAVRVITTIDETLNELMNMVR